MNPVLILAHNCLEQTKRAVTSVRSQSVATDLHIIDNGSTDGTYDWLRLMDRESGYRSLITRFPDNRGVSAGWNWGLRYAFLKDDTDHVLVLNNDVDIPPWFYDYLLGYDLPFVTGVAVDSMSAINFPALPMPPQPYPDFSAFLIRRDAWLKIGPFNESMKLYASDCDYHVRGHHLGIPMMKANVPFYHESSSTLKLATPEARMEIEQQANKDREVFRSIYGCLPGTREYGELFR